MKLRYRPSLRIAAGGLAVALGLAVATVASAGEWIVDPENPAVESEDDAQRQDDDNGGDREDRTDEDSDREGPTGLRLTEDELRRLATDDDFEDRPEGLRLPDDEQLERLRAGEGLEPDEPVDDDPEPADEEPDDEARAEAEDDDEQPGLIIDDPERPELPGDEPEETPEDDEEDDGLVIADPERPDLPGDDPDDPEDEDDEAGLEIDDPEEPGDPGTVRPAAVDFEDTEWNIGYEVGTLVHPRLGPMGRDAVEFVGELDMGLRYDASPRTRAVVSGSFQYWSGAGRRFDDWRTHYEPRLERAYLVHRRDEWSVGVGQMRHSWGSTDLVRPGDVIDPVDFRSPVGGQRPGAALGQLSATASYGGDDWSVQGVFVPFFESHRITLFGRDISVGHQRNPVVGEQMPSLLAALEVTGSDQRQEIQQPLQATDPPRHLPRNFSGGVRGTWTVSGTDLGAGAFFGWDRAPDVDFADGLRDMIVDGQQDQDADPDQQFEEIMAEDGPVLESRFRRRLTVLFDGARYVGPIGVRADVSMSPRRVFYTEGLESVRRPSIFSALGLSYERLLDGVRPLVLTLEGFWLHPFGAEAEPTRWFVSPDERGEPDDPLLIVEDGYAGAVGAVNWATDWWDLEVSTAAIASVVPGDVIGQLTLERDWRSGVTTRLGTMLFWGPDPGGRMTAGGLFAHGNRVFMTVGGRF